MVVKSVKASKQSDVLEIVQWLGKAHGGVND